MDILLYIKALIFRKKIFSNFFLSKLVNNKYTPSQAVCRLPTFLEIKFWKNLCSCQGIYKNYFNNYI
ncbi:unnamed protein product [Meloidogyne enterolobii]|uniref:Uncharacterized protein n=1 Tax=Meloidogyne enterolobii TaxID=390850 RepID=A0ACB0Y7D3_MELEN